MPEMTRNTWVDPVCVECGKMGKLISGEKLDPSNSALAGVAFYLCKCGARVSCHPGTTIPMGRPASHATGKLRGEAHSAFDPIWRGKGRARDGSSARNHACMWLAKQLGIDRDACHFAHFDAETCRRAIEICRAKTKSDATRGQTT